MQETISAPHHYGKLFVLNPGDATAASSAMHGAKLGCARGKSLLLMDGIATCHQSSHI
jgi:hypothetical protein